jgi:hypothetical protein
MTDSELIQTWKDGEVRQKELWGQILDRGLYLKVLGIDPDKRVAGWRNPSRLPDDHFFAGVHGAPRGSGQRVYKRPEKPIATVNLSDEDFDDFV